MVFFSLFPTPLGSCGIAWRGGKVVGTHLSEETADQTERRLVARTGATRASPPTAIRNAIRLITALLEGQKADLCPIACDLGAKDSFSVEVYALTREVQAGNTSTYGAIASELGDKGLARRVGQILGRNPLPIIVPCHRIIGTDGKLVGFSANGGVQMKLRMLEIERARIGDTPSLFDNLPLATKPRQ